MPAEIHHLHNAISAVCPIVGICGDIRNHKAVRVDFKQEATDEQKAAARAIVESFDPSRKYEPDAPAFLDALAQDDSFNDFEFHSISRALKINNLEARMKYLSKSLALSEKQKETLSLIAREHCIDLSI